MEITMYLWKHETSKIAQKTDVKVGMLIIKSLKINRWATDEDDARTCTPNADNKTVSEELPVRLLCGGGNRLDGCGGGGGGVGNGGRPGQQSNKRRRRRRRYRIVPTPTDPRHTTTAAVEPHRHRWRNYPVVVTIIIIFCFCAVVVEIMTMDLTNWLTIDRGHLLIHEDSSWKRKSTGTWLNFYRASVVGWESDRQ